MLVIGGGAAGMMCAVTAARMGAKVTVLERNEKIGRKLYITGKGRCNVTNATSGQDFYENIVTNARFLYGALSRFDSCKTMEFFEEAGVPLKIERGNRVFPESDKSADIIDALWRESAKAGVRITFGCRVQTLTFEDNRFVARTNKGVYEDGQVVIATGGVTYAATGSTGDGYAFARAFGHTVVPPVAALVGIRAEGTTSLAGLTLKNVAVTVEENGKTIASAFGEMLYTHTGVSGPTVLTLSSRINRRDVAGLALAVDMKPAVTVEELDDRLRHTLAANNKQLINAVVGVLPNALVASWLDNARVDPRKVANSVTKEERERLAKALKRFVYPIAGLEPIDGAVVTAGGVSVKEVDPKTMESKLVKGLYFAGEVLDVDALTGGFNLQIAFATGYTAAYFAAQKEINV